MKPKGKRVYKYYAEDNGKGWVKCEGKHPELYTRADVAEIMKTYTGSHAPTFVRINLTYEIIEE